MLPRLALTHYAVVNDLALPILPPPSPQSMAYTLSLNRDEHVHSKPNLPLKDLSVCITVC